jgi:hypothetical protein
MSTGCWNSISPRFCTSTDTAGRHIHSSLQPSRNLEPRYDRTHSLAASSAFIAVVYVVAGAGPGGSRESICDSYDSSRVTGYTEVPHPSRGITLFADHPGVK